MTRSARPTRPHRPLRAPLVLASAGVAAAAVMLAGPAAHACGCFTPPDPSVPVVQAGERIAFAIEDGQVTAHIQIQYAGDAAEFGWLLPLPSVPTLELGTDELFNQLVATTQPKYRLVRQYDGNCGFGRGVSSPGASGAGGAGGSGGGAEDGSGSPLVIQDSIGPYDYAVLKADDKAPMLAWLADNRYFVPAGTDETVGAYIRPGAFFLALKLRSGKSTGDLQPVVLRYPSDLPMIPIILTSVAAQPNMGIQVFMLGAGRAIPRNYYHTVISDRLIDWFRAGANYNDVIIKAVGEAPGKHAYVTEYAGPSDVMKNKLDYLGRFGAKDALAASVDAYAFVEYMLANGYPLTGQVLTILGRYIPYPTGLAKVGITPQSFYQSLRYFLEVYRRDNPAPFAGWPGITYKPADMAAELEQAVVAPTRAAAALFDRHPTLTRLYTTLSPEDMNLDPVFSFNPGLPPVANVHEATLTYFCGMGSNDPSTTPARLLTPQGWVTDFPYGTGGGSPAPPDTGPYARRIEILRETGGPEVIADHGPPQGGCACATGATPASASRAGALAFALLVGTVLVARRRSRRP